MKSKLKLRSSTVNGLNEALQKLVLNDKITEFTPVIVEADGKFSSIVNTTNDIDLSTLGSNITTEEQPEKTETKQQLLNQFADVVNQNLEYSQKLQTILKKIKELSKDTDSNKWVVNKQGNTATLADKNAYIFKQNNNLCLSHSGKVELFKSVQELRNWLEKYGYPLPDENIVIHESIKEDTNNSISRNWYDLFVSNNEKQLKKQQKDYEKKQADPTSDIKKTQRVDIPNIYDHEYKKIKPLSRWRVATKFPSSHTNTDEEDVQECFGGSISTTSSLGSAVAYTGNKKEKKEEKLQEAFQSLIPNGIDQYAGKRNQINNFLSWWKKNGEAVKSGDIKYNNLKDVFYKEIEPFYIKTGASDTVSRVWLNIIDNTIDKISEMFLEKNQNKNLTKEKIVNVLLNKPNQIVCNELSKQLNKYIPEDDIYQYGKVNLIPNVSLLDINAENDNYKQRKNWQDAYFNAVLNGKTEIPRAIGKSGSTYYKQYKNLKDYVDSLNSENIKTIDNPEFTAQEIKVLSDHNIDINNSEYPLDKLHQLANMFLETTNESYLESKLFESIKKYPWLNKIMGQRLVEDDTPADFATGSPLDSNLTSTDTNTTDTTTDTTSTNVDMDNLGNDLDNLDVSSGNDGGFGDLDISFNGDYSPEGDENSMPAIPNAPEQEITDVLINDEDPSDIKIKVQDLDTKKTSEKGLNEIDV